MVTGSTVPRLIRTDFDDWTPEKPRHCHRCRRELLTRDGKVPLDIFNDHPKSIVRVTRTLLYDNNRRYPTDFIFCSMKHLEDFISWNDDWKDAMSDATIEDMYNRPDPYKAPPVDGYCPMGCGAKLALGEDGRVFCQNRSCPDQHAVAAILADGETEHLVYVGQYGGGR